MCASSAVVDRLECYMEDMIECFEDFVKKTLFVITLAAGALIAVVMYLLKNMTASGRTYVTGTETQMNQVLGENLHEATSSSNVSMRQQLTPKGSITKTTKDFVLSGTNKNGIAVSVASKENLLVNTSSVCIPRKSTSCLSENMFPACMKLSKCPSSTTKICVKKSPCSVLSCSQVSSCEKISCRESAPSICSKISCPTKAPVSVPSCNRPCSLSTACKRTCIPPFVVTRTCPKSGNTTIPSLITCKNTKYKLGLPACANVKPCNIPCNIPKRCSTKSRPKTLAKSSCCSLCCDKDE